MEVVAGRRCRVQNERHMKKNKWRRCRCTRARARVQRWIHLRLILQAAQASDLVPMIAVIQRQWNVLRTGVEIDAR
jgi:hypothetical protein